jgi:hypothetical protein
MTTKKNYRRAFAGMLLGGLFLTVQTASAQIWSSAASACTPDEDTVTGGLYDVFYNGTLLFKAGKTGSIKARCSVTNPIETGASPGWNLLTVGYLDPDGTGANYQVYAQLIAVKRDTGVITVVKSFYSDSFATTTPTSHTVTFLGYAWDFANYAYYVGINVERASTAGSPGVWFVKLSKN